MKIYSIEVETDLGRRVVKLSAPIEVDPRGGLPPQFNSLVGVLWGVVQQVAIQGPELAAALPKVEA